MDLEENERSLVGKLSHRFSSRCEKPCTVNFQYTEVSVAQNFRRIEDFGFLSWLKLWLIEDFGMLIIFFFINT